MTGDILNIGGPAQQRIIVQEANTGTTEVQEQQETTIVPANTYGEGTTTADVLMEAHTGQTGTPEAPTEIREERDDTTDPPVVTSNPIEPIAPGPTIASSSEQVTLHGRF